jgi:WD40 repeat protein/serine/threonine protein kinase
MKDVTSFEEAGSETSPQAEWHKGQLIEDLYEVGDVLGEGGMGKVYKVWHRNWNLFLAVKSPKWEIFQNADLKKNFTVEAETWVNLDLHPNVVTCYYVSEISGIPRIFIEYLEGGTLKQWIHHEDKKGKLYHANPEISLERILDISIQTAWGLLHAHQHHIIHQDMKPENILMTPDGIAKVTDFGLTRAAKVHIDKMDSSGGKSVMATYGGMTPAYCSPEQARREKVTRRSDLWSWAVTVLEMFVGGIEWPSGSLAGKVLELKLASPAFLVPMPDPLADLLKQCFKINPDERPHSMEEVVQELRTIYVKLYKKPYPRNSPGRIQAKSDMLNNRALSMIDMKKMDEAEHYFQESLKVNPHHPETIYNRGLCRYYSGKIKLVELLSQLGEETLAPASKPWIKEYLFGLICLEQNEPEAARDHFNESLRLGGGREIRGVLNSLENRLLKQSGAGIVYQSANDSIQSLCFFPDGKKFLAGNLDGTLVMHDAFSDRESTRWEGHLTQISSLVIQGEIAVTGSYDHTIRIWNLSEGKCLQTLSGHQGPVLSLSLSNDFHYLLSGSADKTVRLWDLKSGESLQIYSGYKHWVIHVKFASDSQYFFSGSLDGMLYTKETSSGKLKSDINFSIPWVNAMEVSSDGKIAAVVGWDHQVQLWEIERAERYHILLGHEDRVNTLSMSPDRLWLVSGSNDKTVRLWNLLNGKCARILEGHTERVLTVALNTDCDKIISGGTDHTLRLWDISYFSSPGRSLRAPYVFCQAIDPEQIKKAQTKFVNSLYQAKSLSEKGQLYEALKLIEDARRSAGYEKDLEALCLRVIMGFKTKRASLEHIWKLVSLEEGHQDKITTVRICSNGKHVLSGSRDKNICLWDTGSGHPIKTYSGHLGEITALDVSRDLNYILSGSADNTLRLWDFKKGELLQEWLPRGGTITSVAFSPNGNFAVSSGYDRVLRLWHIASGQSLASLSGHKDYISSVVFSPDNQRLLSAGWDALLCLWDLRTGKQIRSFQGHSDYIHSVTLNLDGTLAASGSADKTLRIWDTASGRCQRVLEGHTDPVNVVRFTSDGQFLLSGSSDKTLRAWSVETGECIFVHHGEIPFQALDLSQDGRFLANACPGFIQVHELDWAFKSDEDNREKEKMLDGQLRIFLANHTPYSFQPAKDQTLSREELSLTLTPKGKAQWNEQNFKELLTDLSFYGLGWITPLQVTQQLQELNT